MEHTPTEEQEDIIRWFRRGSGHMLIDARAGSAKTTTIIEGAIFAPEPSVLLCAFNAHAARELTERLPTHRGRVLHAMTLHSVGNKICRENWAGLKLNPTRTEEITRKVFERAGVPRRFKFVSAVGQTVSFTKSSLPLAETIDDIILVGEERGTLLPEKDLSWEVQATLALSTLEACKKNNGSIGYDDMDWLPIANGWEPRGRYKLVIVDEAQDTSVTQLMLARKMVAPITGRLVFVGDRYQAIYKFRGADQYSFDRIQEEIPHDTLPLNTSFRCSKNVVREAQRIVPSIRYFDTALDGKVSTIDFREISLHAKPGDFVLSRTNAPLVSVCISLRRAGLKAFISGKQILQQAKNVLKRIERSGTDIYSFENDVAAWMQKEVAIARSRGSVIRSQNALDFGQLLLQLAKRASSMEEISEILEELFEGRRSKNAIVCATVHRVKGLESDRVFILRDTLPLYNGGMRWDSDEQEEKNIEYVAITRARQELFWVVGLPAEPKEGERGIGDVIDKSEPSDEDVMEGEGWEDLKFVMDLEKELAGEGGPSGSGGGDK
jgi:DNA helicase-2/ATP-dependent DNA helicase PcrA